MVQENKKRARNSENLLFGVDNGDSLRTNNLQQDKDPHKARVLSAIADYHHKNEDNRTGGRYSSCRGI